MNDIVFREWQAGEPGTKSRRRRERRRLPGRIAGWCAIGALALATLATAFAPVACWVPWLDLHPQRRAARAWLRDNLDVPKWSEIVWTQPEPHVQRLKARIQGWWGMEGIARYQFEFGGDGRLKKAGSVSRPDDGSEPEPVEPPRQLPF